MLEMQYGKHMKIEGDITIYANDGYVDIHIRDRNASTGFVELRVSSEGFVAALGRLGHVPCELTVRNLDHVGKNMENGHFEFKLPDSDKLGRSNEKELALEAIKTACPQGWTPDLHFNSQNSFFTKNGHRFARTIIRRWV